MWSNDVEIVLLLEPQRKEKEFNMEVNAIRTAMGSIEPIKKKQEGVKKDGRRK